MPGPKKTRFGKKAVRAQRFFFVFPRPRFYIDSWSTSGRLSGVPTLTIVWFLPCIMHFRTSWEKRPKWYRKRYPNGPQNPPEASRRGVIPENGRFCRRRPAEDGQAKCSRAAFSHFGFVLAFLGSKKGSIRQRWFPLFNLFFSPRSRHYFFSHFGRVRGRFGVDFGVVLGSIFAASPWQHPCGNLAKTLHKNLQTPWATPPARTNSEGAAVSR